MFIGRVFPPDRAWQSGCTVVENEHSNKSFEGLDFVWSWKLDNTFDLALERLDTIYVDWVAQEVDH